MAWSVKIICDSVNPAGVRLTTFELEYPLIVHNQVLTHRVFSRNAASNRAIPFARLSALVESDPFIPERWPINQAGMVGNGFLTGTEADLARQEWLAARDSAIFHAQRLADLGVHKEITNRILLPYQWVRVLISSTTWDNWFKLRDHGDAQPEIVTLAQGMKREMYTSKPCHLTWGDWHMPYIDKESEGHHCDELLMRYAVARCARVSYLNHDKVRDWDKDLKLHADLAESGHWSPFEHVAQAVNLGYGDGAEWDASNFHPSWMQYRKCFAGESGLEDLC